MAAQTQLSPQNIAAQHMQQVQAQFPNLNEPHKGAFNYAVMVSNNPELDAVVCQAAGKVVHIVAKLANKADHPVTLRGSLFGVLDWNTDRAADPQKTQDLYSRTFTFHVPNALQNQNMEFKLCLSPVNHQDQMRWASQNNWIVDLSKFGHIAIIEVSNVAFN